MKIDKQDIIAIISEEREKCNAEYEEINSKTESWKDKVEDLMETLGKLKELNAIQKIIMELE